MSRSSASGCTAAAASATIAAAAATAAATADSLSRPRSVSPNSALVSPEPQSPPSTSAAAPTGATSPASTSAAHHHHHNPYHAHHHHHHHHPHPPPPSTTASAAAAVVATSPQDWTAAVHHGTRTVLAAVPRPKPRLTRQSAISDDDPPGSPGRLAVRFLTTIPSAAENSVQMDEDEGGGGTEADEEAEEDAARTPLVPGRRSLPTVKLVALPASVGARGGGAQRRPSNLSSPPRTVVALQLLDSRPAALLPLRRASTGQTSHAFPAALIAGPSSSRSPPQSQGSSSPGTSAAPSAQMSPSSPGSVGAEAESHHPT